MVSYMPMPLTCHGSGLRAREALNTFSSLTGAENILSFLLVNFRGARREVVEKYPDGTVMQSDH